MSSANCISHVTAFVDHLDDLAVELVIKEVRLFVADFLMTSRGERHVGRFVAKDPVRAGRESVEQAF